ncbi:MAG: SH3 domain-containing protein [Treponema sp.]|jgi:hypothetical protein|nr:SH3 domain-containing protein [Treponema sp.]
MKNILFRLPALVMLAFCLGSCSKPPEPAETGEPQETETPEPAEEAFKQPLGVILTEASLQELRDDGKMYWKANLSAGDTVIWKDEKMNAVRSYDNLRRDFYRVDFDGGDYWVQDYAIAGPAEPAVIVGGDTLLYTKPDPTAVARTGNISIPRYSLVALLPDEDISDDYVKITARLEGTSNPPVNDRYVKAQNVSTDINDVGAVKLARIASGTNNPAVRAELVRNALDFARKSLFLNRTAEELNYDPVFFELELMGNLERLASEARYMVTADTVNVRETPSVAAKALSSLSQGTTVWISAKTKREITLDAPEGEEAPKGAWYKTGDGWIFGAYIVPVPQ